MIVVAAARFSSFLPIYKRTDTGVFYRYVTRLGFRKLGPVRGTLDGLRDYYAKL